MIKSGKVNFILDALYGSSAKGQVATAVAKKYKPEILTANHGTSSSHTVVVEDQGIDSVFKALPSASVLNKTEKGYKPIVFVPASAVFEIDQIIKEIKYCELDKNQVWIHPRASVVSQRHKDLEAGQEGTKHLGSTMSGQSYAFAEKINRKRNASIAKNYMKELEPYAKVLPDTGMYIPAMLFSILKDGGAIFAEMPQGFPLSIDHGPEYPYSTYRNITPTQFLADLGLSHNFMGSIIGNVRSLPIRVSNRFKNNDINEISLLVQGRNSTDKKWVKPSEIGMEYSDVNAIAYGLCKTQSVYKFGDFIIYDIDGVEGVSGPFEPDMSEISWRQLSEQLSEIAGSEKKVQELTTLTKLVRRIAKPYSSLSTIMMRKFAVSVNPTHLSFTFMNYIDPRIEGVTNKAELVKSDIIRNWLDQAKRDLLEAYKNSGLKIPEISIMQTGKDIKNVVFL